MFPFNVRVYAIIINSKNEILLSDESHQGISFTKFPGGGLQFGEGTIDGLRREIKEELNAEISEVKHFYTTDFFQQSAFDSNQQVISVYYTTQLKDETVFLPKGFHWKKIKDFTEKDVTLPIDKKVAGMLIKNQFGISIP